MESAERNGSDLRRLLRSAERFNEAAIRLGFFRRKDTALERERVAVLGHLLRPAPSACGGCAPGEPGFLRRMFDLRAGPARRLDAAAFLAMMRTI